MADDRIRIALIADYLEEGWPSMDLCAESLLQAVQKLPDVEPYAWQPGFCRRASRLPGVGRTRFAFNFDRLVNRHWDYPRFLSHRPERPDWFHICDHSYAHLVHSLPAERTGVFCHDLDTFRCLLEPDREPRPWWFRKLAARTLSGLERAAVVFFSTESVRREIESRNIVDPTRLVQAPYGVAHEFKPPQMGESPRGDDYSFLLNVGSCIPRKRVDVLLNVFAQLRGRFPALRLCQVGGSWTAEQVEQMRQLGIRDAVEQRRGLQRNELAELYRRARLIIQCSEAEGFGIPVIEALACGSDVVASDLPVVHEVAGDAVTYCPVGDINAWVEACTSRMIDPTIAPDRSCRLAQAAGYSWDRHAAVIVDAYKSLDQRISFAEPQLDT